VNNTKEYKGILKDSGTFAIGTFGSKIISFLFVPLYTSYLSTAEYGTADLVNMAVSLIFPILTCSISEGVLRFCYQKDSDYNDILSVFVFVIIGATLINILLSLLGVILFPFIKPYLIYYIPLFIVTSTSHGLSNFLKGIGKIKLFAGQGIFHTIVLVAANLVLLVLLGYGLPGYFISIISANFLTIIFIIICGKLYEFKINLSVNKKLLSEMLKYSLPLVPATIAWWINISADKYMISGMIGVSANGLYSVAHQIPAILTTLTGLFTQAWQISAMRNYGNHNFQELFTNVLKSVNCVLAVGSVSIIILCKFLASILFRNDFYVAWVYVPLLVLSAVFSAIAGTLASAYTAAKKTNILFISTCVGAGVNIVLNYFLIKLWGISGAALSTVISFIVIVVVRYILLGSRVVKIKYDVKIDVLSFSIILIEAIMIAYSPENFFLIAIVSLVLVYLINAKKLRHLIHSMLSMFKR
jgi:O-antigen/teichoic acid export membrane protein